MNASAVPAVDTASSKRRRRSAVARLMRALPAVTLVAVLTITASAEYELARTVLDLSPRIAWALPVAVDSYVLAALHSRKDVAPALAVMAGALTASMGAHLAVASHPDRGLPGALTAPLATAIMTVLVVVAWRVHVLIDTHHHDDTTGDTATGDLLTEYTPPGYARPEYTGDDTSAVSVSVSTLPAVAARPLPRPTPTAPSTPPTPPRVHREDEAKTPGTDPNEAPSIHSDEQILAALTGEPPSIRALMRTYGIGQARASRIRQAAQQGHPAPHPGATARTTAGNRTEPPNTTHDTVTEHEEPTMQGHDEIQNHDSAGESEESTTRNSTGIRTRNEDRTHTCITDRVGQVRSTKESVDQDERSASGVGAAVPAVVLVGEA